MAHIGQFSAAARKKKDREKAVQGYRITPVKNRRFALDQDELDLDRVAAAGLHRSTLRCERTDSLLSMTNGSI